MAVTAPPRKLRGTIPEPQAKRLKALFHGPAGVGKTTAAIQFPKPYLIDTEKGAGNDQYLEMLRSRGGSMLQSNDFEDIVSEVTALLSVPHDFQTLIIDPITTVYDDLIEKAEGKVGTEFGRHYGEAKKRWKRLANLLMRLDMNVIITSHEKNEYAPGEAMKVVGKTYDGPKGLDYMFDVWFGLERRGKDIVGVVRKTRLREFQMGDVFPFNYDTIADKYGRGVLERKAKTETLATPDQVAELTSLLADRKNGGDMLEKWLTKAQADSPEEMPAEVIAKCIAFLKGGE